MSLNKSKCTEGLRDLQQDLTCKRSIGCQVFFSFSFFSFFFFNLAAKLTKSNSFLQTDYTLHVDVLISYLKHQILYICFLLFITLMLQYITFYSRKLRFSKKIIIFRSSEFLSCLYTSFLFYGELTLVKGTDEIALGKTNNLYDLLHLIQTLLSSLWTSLLNSIC